MSWKDLFCLILKGTWLAIGMEDGINELEGPFLLDFEGNLVGHRYGRWYK